MELKLKKPEAIVKKALLNIAELLSESVFGDIKAGRNRILMGISIDVLMYREAGFSHRDIINLYKYHAYRETDNIFIRNIYLDWVYMAIKRMDKTVD